MFSECDLFMLNEHKYFKLVEHHQLLLRCGVITWNHCPWFNHVQPMCYFFECLSAYAIWIVISRPTLNEQHLNIKLKACLIDAFLKYKPVQFGDFGK